MVKEISEILGPLKTEGMTDLLLLDAYNQAKAMDKEQKIEFANEYLCAVMGGCLLTPTEFYNETFKSE